jgi:hypothetical protein
MILVYNSQASASLRRIPMWLVGSNGTTPPTTQAGAQPQINWLSRGAVTVNTAATLSAVSVLAGEYYVELALSEVSAIGVAQVQFGGAAVLPASTYFQIANWDSGNSADMGVAGFSQVTLHQGTHSNATIQGVQNYANISNVTLAAGTHSNVTIQGVTQMGSSVTIHDADYSAVTVRISPQAYSGLTVGVVNIAPATYSGVTVGISGIAPASYSGVTVEVSNIARASMQSQADRVLLRGLATNSDGGRTVQDALRPLRNRVALAGSIMTVFTEDDATSAWTSSVATSSVAAPIIGLDPSGP